MAGGAILNAAAFIGGNYLARALGGGDDAALKEKERHDKALEAYQAAYAKYSRDRTKLLDWIETNNEIKQQAKQNFTNTDYAFKLYNQAHPDKQMILPKEPKFSDFYQPSEQQKQERLFGYQYGVEMNLPSGQRSTAWVKRLPEVVAALNNEVTSLTGKKPAAAIKEKAVSSKPSSKYTRPVGSKEKKLPSLVNVRYLYQPGELEGGVKRATDPIWSLKVYSIERTVTKPDQPVLYYLHDGPKRGFVREELLVIPPNTQLPPEKL
ncbi:hypothetical protein ACROYT_G021167 [Oculina patagonica]